MEGSSDDFQSEQSTFPLQEGHPGSKVSITAADFSLLMGEICLCLNLIPKPQEHLSKGDAKDHLETCISSYVLLKRLRQLCS